MYKKIFIIGFLFLCIGGSLLWWVISERQDQQREEENYKSKYGSETTEYIKQYEQWLLIPPDERTELPLGFDINANKTTQQILQEQQERLIADMDKLSAGEMTVYPFVDDFYGQNWQERIVEYKKQKEQIEFLFTSSIVCTSIGGITIGWIILLGIARLFIKILKGLKKLVSRNTKTQEQSKSQEDDSEKDIEDKETNKNKDEKGNIEQSEQDNQFKNLSNVLVNSGWQYAGSFGEEKKSGLRQRKRIPLKSRANIENKNDNNSQESSKTGTIEQEKQAFIDNTESNNVQSQNRTESETIIKKNVDITNEKKQSSPIDTTLKDLTQQVSAIREYAANQQNRLERFQDGYDWNIIKTFCLRIIRCIDNIETRIANLSDDNNEAQNLEEVKDELVFALESSGIEQFEPEINSEYRGQEKVAEAVKEKAKSNEPENKGKIEKVIRPGYQFYIDEENIRIVRPAQVRLFA